MNLLRNEAVYDQMGCPRRAENFLQRGNGESAKIAARCTNPVDHVLKEGESMYKRSRNRVWNPLKGIDNNT